ncbi:MAG: thiamine-phosphate kinase [Planctomycetota bacterium]
MPDPTSISDVEIHRWLRELTIPSSDVLLGIGSDCGVVRWRSRNVVIKTDPVIEGIHFERGFRDAGAIVRKALGRVASDFAAAGAFPKFTIASVVFPKGETRVFVKNLLRKIQLESQRYSAPLVGGHTGFTHGRELEIHATMIGACYKNVIGRGGAKPGDVILATGTFGGSRLGRHLRPEPRLTEMFTIATRVSVHAAIDVSDGFSLDLARLCEMSRVGAIVKGDAIPCSAAAKRLAKKRGQSPLFHALSDGEDYELLIAVSKRDAARALQIAKQKGFLLNEVAELTSDRSLWLVNDGVRRPLQLRGFVQRSNS